MHMVSGFRSDAEDHAGGPDGDRTHDLLLYSAENSVLWGIAGSSDNRRDSTISKLCGFLVEQPRTRSIEKPSSPNRYWNSRRLEVSFLGHEIKQGDAFNTEMPGDIGNLCATRRLIGRLSNILLKGDDF